MEKLDILVKRLSKINIDIELALNFPWVYLTKVNGNKVKEKFKSDYYFTICFLNIKVNQEMRFTDISKIFEIIRKYK